MMAETALPCYGCTGYTSTFRAPVNNNIQVFSHISTANAGIYCI